VENRTGRELEGSEKFNVAIGMRFYKSIHPKVGKLRMRERQCNYYTAE